MKDLISSKKLCHSQIQDVLSIQGIPTTDRKKKEQTNDAPAHGPYMTKTLEQPENIYESIETLGFKVYQAMRIHSQLRAVIKCRKSKLGVLEIPCTPMIREDRDCPGDNFHGGNVARCK